MVDRKLSRVKWDRLCQAAFGQMLASPEQPDTVSAAFEPLLADVFFHKDGGRVEKLRNAAKEVFDRRGRLPGPVSLEVRHLCWHLRHLGERGFCTSSVIDLYVI